MLVRERTRQRRCRRLVNALTLPDQHTPQGLAQVVAAHLGVRIVLVPTVADGLPAGVTGVVHVNARGDYRIAYADDEDAWRSLVFVAHELGHVLCGHIPRPTASPEQAEARQVVPPPASPAVSLPGSPPDWPPAPAGAPLQVPAGQSEQPGNMEVYLDLLQGWGGAMYRCLDDHSPAEHEAELLANLLVERLESARRAAVAQSAGFTSPAAARYTRVLQGSRRRCDY